jgi:hypothetical protein
MASTSLRSVLGTAAMFAHALRRQNAGVLALPDHLARPRLRAGAGFHQDGAASRQHAQKRREGFARFDALLVAHLAKGVLACNLKDSLGQIHRYHSTGSQIGG